MRHYGTLADPTLI